MVKNERMGKKEENNYMGLELLVVISKVQTIHVRPLEMDLINFAVLLNASLTACLI